MKKKQILLSLGLTLCVAGHAAATTKGLNQIVTPDIQPQGQLSVSFQQVDPNVANRLQVQLELGITKQFEVAVFEGFSPQETILNAEYGIVQSKHFLLSTGFANYSSNGTSPQPYLEAGYLQRATYVMIGVLYAGNEFVASGQPVYDYHQTQAILGGAYRVAPRLLVQADYQGGSSNFSSVGFAYNITPQLQFNPAVYFANTSDHTAYGYAVLTWNIQAFSPH